MSRVGLLHQPVIDLHVPEKLARTQADGVGGGEEVVEGEGWLDLMSPIPSTEVEALFPTVAESKVKEDEPALA